MIKVTYFRRSAPMEPLLFVGKNKFNTDIKTLLKDIEESIDFFPGNTLYLKDVNSTSLIKVEIIDNNLVINYILDLFDFEKEFDTIEKQFLL